MNRDQLLQKLEDGIASLRKSIEENDGSTLSTIKNAFERGFDTVKEAFTRNETAQKACDEIKKQFDDFESAVKRNDKELSMKLLDSLEAKITAYKAKYAKGGCGCGCHHSRPDEDEPPIVRD